MLVSGNVGDLLLQQWLEETMIIQIATATKNKGIAIHLRERCQ